MPNIHSLSSLGNNNNNVNREEESDEEDNNNRYVGGVSNRGGGSGLEVTPNPQQQPVEGIFRLASSEDAGPDADARNNRHVITMYRGGFTVDNGVYRRLDDPANAEFLTALAGGRTPREFGNASDLEVALIDKRSQEYDESERVSQPFAGTGATLGSNQPADTGGVIDPSTTSSVQPPDDNASDLTSIQIRLLSKKRLVVKISKSASVNQLVYKINESGMAGTAPYLLSCAYPPKILKNMNETISEAGLAGSSVIQKAVS